MKTKDMKCRSGGLGYKQAGGARTFIFNAKCHFALALWKDRATHSAPQPKLKQLTSVLCGQNSSPSCKRPAVGETAGAQCRQLHLGPHSRASDLPHLPWPLPGRSHPLNTSATAQRDGPALESRSRGRWAPTQPLNCHLTLDKGVSPLEALTSSSIKRDKNTT